jgi:DNA-binding NtrC family response regulator
MNDTVAPVCVVDDDASIRESVGSLIRSVGLRAETFESANDFLASRRAEASSCLVLDVQMPGLSGLELQQELAKADVQIPIVFLTGRGDIPMSVRAIKAGALEFLTKPVDDEQLLNAIRQGVARFHTLSGQGLNPNEATEFDGIVGSCRSLKQVLAHVAKVAPTDSTVLITGETGTGKELIARAVHKLSRRAGRAFVAVNCAAIASSLISSELFGHERGAFTGATQRRQGRFELAEGGTLFLDEIGELPEETQIALLRVLQEREFERVGGTQTVSANVRVIAATNRNLEAAIADGKFRRDLFYRLNVFPIAVPPLRQRREDIPSLVETFVGELSRSMGRTIDFVPRATMEALQHYDWPGNIRELRNVIERGMIVSRGNELHVELPTNGAATASMPSAPEQRVDCTLEEFGKRHIMAVLDRAGWKIAGKDGAASRLGMNRTTLQGRMRKLGIRRPQ